MARVSVEGIGKKFGKHVALEDLSLDIENGQFFILLGPTGAGKTTALRLIAGLEKHDSGVIKIDGQDVGAWSAAERDVALVLQQYSLYPRYTVRQNLEFPLRPKMRALNQAEIDDRVTTAAKIVRVEHLLDRKTDRLSGGEMQRVSIGRAIVRRPKIFLMDEPLSNLDAKLRELLRAELKDLKIRLGATFLFVTHDQVEAMSMGDRIAVLNGGRIVQVGTPYEIYNRPRDTFVATFVGSPAMNLVSAECDEDRITVVSGEFELGFDERGKRLAGGRIGAIKCTLGFRAEDVRISEEGATAAIVHGVENHGVEKVVTLRTGNYLIRSNVPATLPINLNATVRFSINPDRLHYFDAATGVSFAAEQ
jgi:multiple sugar transport system ATP-binding protein